MKRVTSILSLFRQTFQEWNEDRAPRLAAALAYYTAFALGPLMLIIIAIFGLVVTQDTIRSQILYSVARTLGSDAAEFVNELVTNADRPAEGLISTVIGIVTLFLSAAGAFGQLQDALNTIWDVEEPEKGPGILGQIRGKFLNFGMVLVVGFMLLVSLVLSTLLSAIDGYVAGLLPAMTFVLQIVSTVVSFGVVTVLFALIFKFLPKVRVEWRDVWIGAALTSLLFSIGKYLLGLYLGNSSTASAYGAAGSFVLILLWIYYSAQIVLFGAEFTQVYSKRVGSKSAQPDTKVVGAANLLPERAAALAHAAETTVAQHNDPQLEKVVQPAQQTQLEFDSYQTHLQENPTKNRLLVSVIFVISTIVAIGAFFFPSRGTAKHA